jgi:ArsR family transcriptional regulator
MQANVVDLPVSPPDRLSALEGLFKALGDRTRLRILALLARGEVCVCDIHGSLQIPQPTASRHLAYLRRAGLVATRKRGLWVHYRLADLDDPVARALVEGAIGALDASVTVGSDPGRLGRRVLADLMPAIGACCRPSSS